MSYFNKAWMAVGVAAVHGHSDQAVMLKSGFSSLKAGKRRFFSGGESSPADLRPLAAVVRTEIDSAAANHRDGEERGKQTDESLKNVMYLNCWGQLKHIYKETWFELEADPNAAAVRRRRGGGVVGDVVRERIG